MKYQSKSGITSWIWRTFSKKRLLYCFVWLLIFSILSYRIIDWTQENFWVNDDVVLTQELSKSSEKYQNHGSPHLLLCNINPVKGTRIFLKANGSKVYDILSDSNTEDLVYQLAVRKILQHKMISKRSLEDCSHKVNDVVKECKVNERECRRESFKKVWWKSKLCYNFPIEPSTSHISWVLDPQEYDYLIPNNGIVGFTVSLNNGILPTKSVESDSSSSDSSSSSTTDNTIIIGPLYQTKMSIKIYQSPMKRQIDQKMHIICANDKQQQLANQNKHAVNSQKLNGKNPCNVSNQSTPDQSSTFSTILSISQYYKSPFFAHLLAPKSSKLHSRNSKTLQTALRIQQRAYLRYIDRGLFYKYQQLFINFQSLLEILNSIHLTYNKLNASYTTNNLYINRQHNANINAQNDCNNYLNIIYKQINIILSQYHQYQLNYTLLRSLSHLNQYYREKTEISLLNSIFNDEPIIKYNGLRKNLQKQFNQAINLKIKLRNNLENSNCHNYFVQYQQLYLNLQNYSQFIGNLTNYLSSAIGKIKPTKKKLDQMRLGTQFILKAFPMERSEKLQKISLMSLVTIDVQVINEPNSNRLKQKSGRNRSKSHTIAEVLGIICGTLGGSVPLLMLLEWCYRLKLQRKSNKNNNSTENLHHKEDIQDTKRITLTSIEQTDLSSEIDSLHHLPPTSSNTTTANPTANNSNRQALLLEQTHTLPTPSSGSSFQQSPFIIHHPRHPHQQLVNNPINSNPDLYLNSQMYSQGQHSQGHLQTHNITPQHQIRGQVQVLPQLSQLPIITPAQMPIEGQNVYNNNVPHSQAQNTTGTASNNNTSDTQRIVFLF